MANNTKKELRKNSIYQIFVRNHSEQGDFDSVTKDIKRIKEMGFDYIYLMPINPIGSKNRKGSLGSPYAISDYRGINKEYGTLDDFKNLLDEAHNNGMKVIIDIVLNHTSPDNVYVENHPDFYYKTPQGNFGNRVGDWTDVIDLDYSNNQLREELYDMLEYWAKLGVDGFRADVASIVPLDFWLEARKRISKISTDFIWVAESVHAHFINMIHNGGWEISNDYEIFKAFDCCYDYDVFDITQEVFRGKYSLDVFKKVHTLQTSLYPTNALKLRHLENHDQPRIASLVQDEDAIKNWMAYSFFAKGLSFVYAGQEFGDKKHPSLFEKDLIKMTPDGTDHTQFITKLNEIKHSDFIAEHNQYVLFENTEDILVAEYYTSNEKVVGIFNVRGYQGSVKIDFSDGKYINMIDHTEVEVKNGHIEANKNPSIIKE